MRGLAGLIDKSGRYDAGTLVHRHRQMIHLMPMQRIDMAKMISYRHARSE